MREELSSRGFSVASQRGRKLQKQTNLGQHHKLFPRSWRPPPQEDLMQVSTKNLRNTEATSVYGPNLLSDQHVEFNDQVQSVNSSQVKRSAYAKITRPF